MASQDEILGKDVEVNAYETNNDDVLPGESFGVGDSLYARLQRFAGKWRIEQRGIERVPEDRRTDRSALNACTFWLSANMVVSSFAVGALAWPVFKLGFVDSLLTILFFNLLGILPVAFFSSLGPWFGLRQVTLSRFYFGYYVVKFIAAINVIACIGWSSVNLIVGAQVLNAVNNDAPGFAGLIIFAGATFLITVFGYKVVHFCERWSWIPSFIIYLIVLGEFAHSGKFSNTPMGSGNVEAASVLSFAASVFGKSATGWATFAADYTCYQPANQSRLKIFLLTFFGLAFPLCFVMMLGTAVGTAMVAAPSYQVAYDQSGIGGLFAAVLLPRLGGFGRFCLVVLALSSIPNNIPNIYSLPLSLQMLGRRTQRVPRFVWTFICTLAVLAIAIPGYSRFETVLENFMLLIASWAAIYEGICLTEHFVFRRGLSGYVVEDFDKPGKLPPGFAAAAAFCFGVFGALMGLAQAWYIGPIGKKIGLPEYGGDVGFELGFAFTVISYLVLRWVERRHFGR